MTPKGNKSEGSKKSLEPDKKGVMLFDKEKADKLFENVRLLSKDDRLLVQKDQEETEKETEENLEEQLIETDQKSCSYCPGSLFSDLSDQRQHYRLDWHRYNLKRSMLGKTTLPEDQFEKILEDLEKDQDDEISGSDESDEDSSEVDINLSRDPKMFFCSGGNEIISIFKCLLFNPKNREIPSDDHIVQLLKAAPRRLTWTILMLGGGHFAGAVFRGQEVLVHKTFHCYTVRAKQGGGQGAADSKSGTNHPKSAGASLRRYNEMSLMQHIQDITQLWEEHINSSQLIFYRATSSNKNALFSGKTSVLQKNDDRIRTIPFPTKRATFNEVKRVHSTLSQVDMLGGLEKFDEIFRSKQPVKQKRTAQHHRSKSREGPDRELPGVVDELADLTLDSTDQDSLEMQEVSVSTQHLQEFDNTAVKRKGKRSKNNKGGGIKNDLDNIDLEGDDDSDDKVDKAGHELIKFKNELLTAVRSGNIRLLDNFVTNVELCMDVQLVDIINHQFGEAKSTSLHLAAKQGHSKVVSSLLALGADPGVRDKAKKVPYQSAQDKETRNAFRKFAGEFPDKFDYKSALIPPPLSKEAEEEKAQKVNEKKKAQRQAKREKEKAVRAEEKAAAEEKKEKERFLGLSDREKRALAAERRMLGSGLGPAVPKQLCFACAADITGRTPFEYGENKFCSVGCVKKHRAAQS